MVDDFCVKYVGKEHADHLVETLQSKYTITQDWRSQTVLWNHPALGLPEPHCRPGHAWLH